MEVARVWPAPLHFMTRVLGLPLQREKCLPLFPVPFDSSCMLQMQEMREGLTGGKPFLGNREILPAGIVDVPGHPRRDLIGGLFFSGEDSDDFLQPDPMVLLEFPILRRGSGMRFRWPGRISRTSCAAILSRLSRNAPSGSAPESHPEMLGVMVSRM